ncbi:MAG TPA: DUF4142 domain-containing protein, partial [Pyrinomonadaceae bacterium]|nr:DUF4142 domain-containing protein [Pyrinomonadaceae bacterium]
MTRTRLLVVVLSVACIFTMLAGMSIAQNQTGGGNANSGQNGNANRSQSGNANRGASATIGVSSADMKFAMTAAQDGMTEVELGRLAVQKGMSDAVKQFGQRMIDDHTNA